MRKTKIKIIGKIIILIASMRTVIDGAFDEVSGSIFFT
jgi:hypothetical protein